MFEELDTVILTHDIEEHSLKKGMIGAVVDIRAGGMAYEVEFVDTSSGRTIAIITLSDSDISPVNSPTFIWRNPLWEGLEPGNIHTKNRSDAETENYSQSFQIL